MNSLVKGILMDCLKSETLLIKRASREGLITIPFLLVLIVILFFFLSFLFLTMTLAHVSITQYMSYATARKLSLAGKDIGGQKDKAVVHYEKLRGQIFKPGAYTGNPGDWFVVSPNVDPSNQLGDIEAIGVRDFNNQYGNRRNMFYGAAVDFHSKIIKFHIPILVKKDQGAKEVKAKVMSFLGREPSQENCEAFNKQRGIKIRDEFSKVPFDASMIQTKEGDNGC